MKCIFISTATTAGAQEETYLKVDLCVIKGEETCVIRLITSHQLKIFCLWSGVKHGSVQCVSQLCVNVSCMHCVVVVWREAVLVTVTIKAHWEWSVHAL